ncbi:DDE-type integrase/transposase/recombinase [Microbulbifer sp. SH-1]|uniref:Mu transposase C-terminal domain-containing protein n=1 Tax=Microbulbifer sp. SH-1 TaxID=2681547 RepID=UPI0014073C10|nr:Mu transposase C-terminal domain-containing protein [Microbulbifer sp. SH-1]QIL91247.1 DDE-type integrase/transposase/recombinase [Microbulbifer sp. SH-1]
MSIELWVEGVIVEFKGGEPCLRAIVRHSTKNEIVLADIKKGTVLKYPRKELEEASSQGRVKFLAESRDFGDLTFFDLTENEQRETNRKYRYIKALQESGISKITEKSSEDVVNKIAMELGEKAPHWQSVRGWYKNYVDSGRKMRGLYPKHRLKGSRDPKIDPRVLDIINQESKRYYKVNQPTMASIFRNVEEKVIAHNLQNPNDVLRVPTYKTVQSRVLDRDYKSRQKGRKGREFKAELSGANSGIETTRVLERVEIDHTLLDIHVIHDDLKSLLGRPSLTVLIDHYSHMVLGFQISFEKPSFASVSMACLNAFLPKEEFMSNLGCESRWPAHGIPSTIVADNGSEFWGDAFIGVLDELGSNLQYCPIRKGNYKSRVERFFLRVNSMVLDDLPGVVRKLGKSGEEYDARQEAKMTFGEFKAYFVNWLTGVYHNLPIESKGMTPNELWEQSAGIFPIAIEDEAELTQILMAKEERNLSKDGIRIFSLDYNSAILKDIYRRDGPGAVTVKYNPFDIGYILILDRLNNVYIKVDCENFAYASGLSLFEHRKIRSAAKEIVKSKMESLPLQQTRVKLARQRDELHSRNSRRKTQVTTSGAARSEKIGVNNIRLVADNTKKAVNFDAESIELDLDGWSAE